MSYSLSIRFSQWWPMVPRSARRPSRMRGPRFEMREGVVSSANYNFVRTSPFLQTPFRSQIIRSLTSGPQCVRSVNDHVPVKLKVDFPIVS